MKPQNNDPQNTRFFDALLNDDKKFGFVIVDGNGALFGTLQGNNRGILQKFAVDLPNKNGRGGQSALRFARLRIEKRHNYLRKVAEIAVETFISGDKVSVEGLILAGSANLKNELAQSDMFDRRLKDKIIKILDISYGGENGFNQAVELSTDTLSNVKFIQEKKSIEEFFKEIAHDSGKYVFGPKNTLQSLEVGAVEKLICWENLDITRIRLKNTDGKESVVNLRPSQMTDGNYLIDTDSGSEMEVLESQPLLEWLTENYKKFGTKLQMVTDSSQEGTQFVRGFGGLGGILRYNIDFSMSEDDEENDDIDLNEY
uniref:Eukaryotic peptide chain release factor subunit 1 n=1 Tax=Panagrolaimus superbus TaxID=310955 RepID=A0A914YZ44_9BILA